MILDELGYLPIDQHGADLLFQVISQRYERGAIALTTNKAYKQWPTIFNNDSTITSRCSTGFSTTPKPSSSKGAVYRMKNQDTPTAPGNLSLT